MQRSSRPTRRSAGVASAGRVVRPVAALLRLRRHGMASDRASERAGHDARLRHGDLGGGGRPALGHRGPGGHASGRSCRFYWRRWVCVSDTSCATPPDRLRLTGASPAGQPARSRHLGSPPGRADGERVAGSRWPTAVTSTISASTSCCAGERPSSSPSMPPRTATSRARPLGTLVELARGDFGIEIALDGLERLQPGCRARRSGRPGARARTRRLSRRDGLPADEGVLVYLKAPGWPASRSTSPRTPGCIPRSRMSAPWISSSKSARSTRTGCSDASPRRACWTTRRSPARCLDRSAPC